MRSQFVLKVIVSLVMLCGAVSAISEDCKEGLKSFKAGVTATNKSEEKASYIKAIELCPAMSEARYNLGVIYEDEGDNTKAIESFTEAYKLKASDRYLTALSRATLASGNFDKPIADISEWLTANATSQGGQKTELFLIRGAAYLKKGDNELAKKDLETVLQKEPSNIPAHINLAIVCERSGDYAGAMTHFQKVLDVEPENSSALLGKAVAAYRNQEYSESLTILQKITTKENSNAEAWELLGRAYKEIGDNDKAELSLRKALQINPKYVNAKKELALILLEKSQPSLALELLNDIPHIDNDSMALTLLGWAKSELGKLSEARTALSRATVLDPNNARAYYNLGVVQERLGDKEGALSAYKKAKELDSELGQAVKAIDRLS